MNLKQPTLEFLMNRVTPDELGAYLDTQTGEWNLVIKNKGLTIPYILGTDAESFNRTKAGVLGQMFVGLTGLMPCEPCNYEYGLTLVRRVKNPGQNNSDYQPFQKFYGSVVNKLLDTDDDGIIDAAQLAGMIASLVHQINSDHGYFNPPAYTNPGAPATAYYGYQIALTGNTDTITINGNAYTGSRDGLVTLIDAVTGLNAIAHPTAANTLYVYSTTALTLTAAGSVIVTGIYFIEKYEDIIVAIQTEAQYYTFTQVVNHGWSRLPYSEVFQIFAFQPNRHSPLAQLTWAQQPLKEDYAMIKIRWPHELPSLDGASHVSMLYADVKLYIPVSALNTAALWDLADPMNDAPTTPNGTLNQLTQLVGSVGWWTAIQDLV